MTSQRFGMKTIGWPAYWGFPHFFSKTVAFKCLRLNRKFMHADQTANQVEKNLNLLFSFMLKRKLQFYFCLNYNRRNLMKIQVYINSGIPHEISVITNLYQQNAWFY